MKINYYLSVFFSFFLLELSAQTSKTGTSNCATIIRDAEILYNNGNYKECQVLLQNGMTDCKFSETEKEDAWILIARADLELDLPTEVDNALKHLLLVNANYRPIEGVYQQDFYSHFNKITVRPQFSAGAHFGLNVPVYSVAKTYSILNGVNYAAPYRSQPGFSSELYFGYEFYGNISLTSGIDYSLFRYKRNLSSSLSDYTMEYNESLNYFSIPLYLKKYFGTTTKKPYLLLGANYNVLQKAVADITAKYSEVDFFTGESDNFTNSLNGIDQKPIRTASFFGIIAGAGFSYKINNLLIQFDVRYTEGLNYFTNSENRLNNQTLIFQYYYVDNAVILNRIELLGSVSYIFRYDVKLRKQP
jgi:hypothetical protein